MNDERDGANERRDLAGESCSCVHHPPPPSIEAMLSEVYAFESTLKNYDMQGSNDDRRPSMSYLNHGSFGDPYPSTLKLRQFYTDLCYRNPMVYHRSLVPILVQRSKARLCDYLDITDQQDGLAFAPISISLFNVLASVHFQRGDVILTTDTLYHSLVDAISHIVATKHLTWVKVETPLGCDPDKILGAFERTIAASHANIKLAILDHISSKPTILYPVQRICELCWLHNIPTLVDGAHVPGALPSQSIHVQDTMATFYAFTLHKWVNVPRGSAAGGLWVNQQDIASRYSSFIDVSKLVVQGGWAEDLTNNTTKSSMYLDASKPGYMTDQLTQGIYDESTREYENILVLPHCLDLVLKHERHFQQHVLEVKAFAVSFLGNAWGLTAIEVEQWDTKGPVPMLSIPLPTNKLLATARFNHMEGLPQRLKYLKQHLVLKLWNEYAIEVPVFVWKDCILGVRISFGRHVEMDDIRRLGDAVLRIVEGEVLP
jgi:selenocysteine lyase/cysteine desulfurase